MIQRLATLVCVAAFFGLAGVATGILIAPAPGSETRGRLAGFATEHGDIVTETLEQGRHLADAVVDFVTTHFSSGDA